MIPFVANVVQVVYATEIYKDRRSGEPELHYGEQAVSAGEELGLLAVLPEQLDSVVHRLGDLVVEGKRDHEVLPPSGRCCQAPGTGGRSGPRRASLLPVPARPGSPATPSTARPACLCALSRRARARPRWSL